MTHPDKADRPRWGAITRQLGFLRFCNGGIAQSNGRGTPNRHHHEFDYEYYVELLRHRADGRSS